MIRSIALAVSAAALFAAAAPAGAAEVRVHVAGKAPAELHADIVKAANTVCRQEVRGEALAVYLYSACVRGAVTDAVSKLNNPEVVAYDNAKPAVYSR
jgi:hypothetical protein